MTSSSLHTQARRSQRQDTLTHIYFTQPTHTHHRVLVPSSSLTHHPLNHPSSPSTFKSPVSSFLAPKHDTPSIRMAQLSFSSFSICSQVQARGGKILFSQLMIFFLPHLHPTSIYTYIHTRTYLHSPAWSHFLGFGAIAHVKSKHFTSILKLDWLDRPLGYCFLHSRRS